MQVTFDIPDALAAEIAEAGQEPARLALEALLVNAYRTGRVTEGEIRRALGYETRMQVHALLAEHDAPLHYSEDMLRQDIEISEKLALERNRAQAA